MAHDTIVSIVVTDKVQTNHLTEFENWQKRIISDLKKFDGFISVSTKKLDGIENEYITLFQFDSNKTLHNWLNSDTLNKYLKEVEQYTLSKPKISLHQGLEFFFNKDTLTIQPPFYKKVIMGIAAVYPLIIVVGKLLHWIIPGFEKLPFELALFFEVIVISNLMNYPVMPMLTKWFHKWLYK
ncbi:hypothetical protein [Aquimarina sp. 2201CG5-10]|uniref:hypothetical protein n=1 Tax=Aquimarina callyspongiae TaxID=3098150 RepID=UPI002AB4B67B|nr:hypothetical protein [Aquimarina sp. 2201CG5-10]MDY8135427.1 hypothetical protein [Aquimarina sp. 2201CG5-10]